jgi:hypothetical protein
MTLRSAAAAGVRGKRDLGGMEEEKGEISVGVPFVADVFLGIHKGLRSSHSSPEGATAVDPGRLWTTDDRPSLHKQTWPQGEGSCGRDSAASSGSWVGEARRRRGRGGAGEWRWRRPLDLSREEGCSCGGSEEGEARRGSGQREEVEGRGMQWNRVWGSFYTKQMQFQPSVR